MKDSTKIVIAGIGILGAAGVAAYAVSQLTGPVGGSCSTPGTPCNTAISPYYQEFLKCSNLYFSDLKAFNAEDAKNGTGFTAGQLSELGYLKSCMDTAAANMAKVAHQYAPANALGILSTFIGEAVVVGAGLVGFSYILKAIKTPANSGSSAADIANNVVIRGSIDDGTITPEQASALSDDISSMTEEDISSFEDFTSLLLDEGIITEETASALVSVAETAMEADEATTVEDLGAL